jgi:hypothetical protein
VRRVLAVLRSVGHRVAAVQTFLLLALVYFVALPVFALSRFGDPLRLRKPPVGEGLWRHRPPVEPTIERFRRLF